MPEDGMTAAQGQMPETSAATAVVDDAFEADFRWVRRKVQLAMEALAHTGIGADDLSSIEIVLAEVLNNVVEHAYPPEAPGKIRLVIRRRRNSLIFEISDFGRPMPEGRAPVGSHPMGDVNADDATPEGGFGWFLIREIVDDLVYDRREDQNHLVFRMALGG